jgi:mannosyltransferase
MSVDTGSLPIMAALRSTSQGRLPRPFVWLIGAVATVLCFVGSWIPSLWGDEAASVLSAKRSIPSLYQMIHHVDSVHATYYFGLHWWVKVFGDSPFSVRFPSAIAVGLAAVALILLSERLAGPRVALIAGIVFCLLPRATYMGEEARSYAFTAAIAAWTLLVLVDLLSGRRSGTKWWVVYGALVSLGIYLFLYLALFIVVHAIVVLAARVPRSLWVRWAIATGAAVVVASPNIIASILERGQVAFLATRDTTGFSSLTVGLWFTNWWIAVVAWALIVVALGFWIRRAIMTRGASTPGRAIGDTVTGRPSAEVVAFAWLLVPGGILLLSTLIVADFSGRYLSMSAPGAAMAMAIGIDRLATRRIGFGIAATALVLAISAPTYLAQRTPYAKNESDWAEVSATIGAHASPGQAVVFDESSRPSVSPRLAYRTYPAGFRGLVDVTLKTPYWEASTWHDRALTVPQALAAGRFTGHSTVWLIEYAYPGHVDSSGLAELQAAGYSVAKSYRTHRSEIIELTRAH